MQNVGPLIVSVPKVVSGAPVDDPDSGFTFAGIIGPEAADPTGGAIQLPATAAIPLVASTDGHTTSDTLVNDVSGEAGSDIVLSDDLPAQIDVPPFWQVLVPPPINPPTPVAKTIGGEVLLVATIPVVAAYAGGAASFPEEPQQSSPFAEVRLPVAAPADGRGMPIEGVISGTLPQHCTDDVPDEAKPAVTVAAGTNGDAAPLAPREHALPAASSRAQPTRAATPVQPDAGIFQLPQRTELRPANPPKNASEPANPGMTVHMMVKPDHPATQRAMVLIADLARPPGLPPEDRSRDHDRDGPSPDVRAAVRIPHAVDLAAASDLGEAPPVLMAVDMIAATDTRDTAMIGPSVLPPGQTTVGAMPISNVLVPLAAVPQVVAAALQDDPARQVELRLDPPELGAVRFHMDQRNADLVVTIIAERPETLDLMRRHADQLLADLRQAGFQGASLNFGSSSGQGNLGQGGFGQHGQGGASSPGPNAQQQTMAFVAATPPPPRAAKGGLNLRL